MSLRETRFQLLSSLSTTPTFRRLVVNYLIALSTLITGWFKYCISIILECLMTPHTGQYVVSFIFIFNSDFLWLYSNTIDYLLIYEGIWTKLFTVYKSFILKQRYIVDMKNIIYIYMLLLINDEPKQYSSS